MPRTYLQTILDSIAEMDIEKLRYYLKDEYSYQDTSKEIFLEKLEVAFVDFKRGGDTILLCFKGKCAGSGCTNCGTGGYRFVGNVSKNHLDLLFEVKGDDIKDIYCCCTFKTNEDAGVLADKCNFYIDRDDEVGFHKKPEYWSKLNEALRGYDELITTPPRTISPDDLQYWVAKYAGVYERIGGYNVFKPSMKWTPFSQLYDEMEQLNAALQNHYDLIMEAAERLEHLDANNEEELIAWLLEYEREFHELPFSVKCRFLRNYIETDNSDLKAPLLFDAEIQKLISVIDDYMNHHEIMISKYSIYTPHEVNEINGDNSYGSVKDNLDSLRFHLDKRREAKEMGVEIALNNLE